MSEEFALLRRQSLGAARRAGEAEGQGAGGAAAVVSILWSERVKERSHVP